MWLQAQRRWTYSRLQWTAILSSLTATGLLYAVVLGPFDGSFHTWFGFLLFGSLAILVSAIVFRLAFARIVSLQAELQSANETTRQANQRLMALHAASIALLREANGSGLAPW